MNTGKSDIANKIFFAVVFTVMFFLSGVIGIGMRVSDSTNFVRADLLFALSAVTGILYDNRCSAAIIALVFGVISDIFLTPPIHLSPILFFLSAYYISKLAGAFTNVNAVTAAVSSIPFFLARSVVGCIYTLSGNDEAGLWYVIKNITLPELAFNITAVFFVYIVVNFIYKRIKRRFYI